MVLIGILVGVFLIFFPIAVITMLIMSRQRMREQQIIHQAALKRAREDLGQ